MIGINTASGFLSLLDEDEPQLHQYALQKLNELVVEFWAEIAHSIVKMSVDLYFLSITPLLNNYN